jgi:hypothetical protein
MEYSEVTLAWLESLTVVCNLPTESGEECLGILAKFYGSDWDPLPTQSAWECPECNQFQCGRELMAGKTREPERRSEQEMAYHMESECAFSSGSNSTDQWKTLVERHLRRQLDAYNAEDGIIGLPVVETEHSIKTLLFLIEAAQRENTLGGLQRDQAAGGLTAGDGTPAEQQAVSEMEVDEQHADHSRAEGAVSPDEGGAKLAQTAAGEMESTRARPLLPPSPPPPRACLPSQTLPV